MATITKQQKKFIEEYFRTNLDATKAAVSAGYSEKSAVQIGSMLLKKPHIMAKIEEVKKEIAETIEVDAEWIKNELVENVKLARKAGKFADSNNAIKMIGELIGEFNSKDDNKNTYNVLQLLGNIPTPKAVGHDVIEVEATPTPH